MSAPTEVAALVPNDDRRPRERFDIRPHGTEARARRERRYGGKPCPSCLAADNAAHACRRRPARRVRGGPLMLPFDKIPAERKAIGNLADPLDDELGLLNVNLAVWIARDDSKADASVTRAGNQVLDSIDAMLSQLHQLRARMVVEYREDQDTAAARADALLAELDRLRQQEGEE